MGLLTVLTLLLCLSSAYLWQDISIYEDFESSPFHPTKAKFHYKVPIDLDCSLRNLAIDYSQELLSGNGYEYIYEALNLSDCSGVTYQRKRANSIHINQQTEASSKIPKKSHKRQSTVEYFVSPYGDDNNPGTFSQPFRTIYRARDQIRISQRTQRYPTTVYLRGGTYYLGDTGSFTLYPEDSGTFGKQSKHLIREESPIVYTNYNDEQVLLSGGIELNLSWKPYRNGIWVAALPSNLSDFNTLFVAGSREIRARFPNGDPSIPYDGYTAATGGFPRDNLTGVLVDIDQPERQTTWPLYQTLYGGSVSRFTAFNSPNYDSRVAYGLYYNESTFTQNKWEDASTGFVHIMHPWGWGSWMYSVEDRDYNAASLSLSAGGWQEARGGPIIGGQLYYVENIFEELDAEREWYSDGTYLYYYPPPQININGVTVVAAVLDCVINVRGFADDPVQFVEFSGLNISHTATTFMKPYEVPSGGDYSVHRGGSVFVEGASNIIFSEIYYDQVGGNGVFLSNYAVNCSIVNSEFYLTGDNAIAAVGTSNLVLASQNAPSYNVIAYNHIHDFGNYGKQSSAYFQSIAHHNYLLGNVIYNGPRAGICFNDGFIGGDVISHNLLFNLVRESGDHGPFNSWDRVPYLYGSPDGTVTTETHFIVNNFIINRNFLGGTFGTRTLDHDDGSTAYTDASNLLLYGSVKFRDGCNRTADDNLIINDEIMSSEMQFLCNFTDNSKEIFSNNTVVIYEPSGLAYECYELPPDSVKNPPFISMNNHFFTPLNASLPFTVVDDCPGAGNITTLAQWQALGFDQFSTISSSINLDEIMSLARSKIGM